MSHLNARIFKLTILKNALYLTFERIISHLEFNRLSFMATDKKASSEYNARMIDNNQNSI